MLNLNRMVVFTGLFVAACQAQTAKPLEFDVVSVKPTAAQGNGTSIRISNGSLTVTGATPLDRLAVMGTKLELVAKMVPLPELPPPNAAP